MPASMLRTALLVLAVTAGLGAHAAEYRYDGRLDDFGRPANGRYDIELSVFGAEKAAAALSAALTFPAVDVRDGRFQLDFEAPLAGSNEAWVQVAVRASGDVAFSAIPGRSKAIAAALVGACWSSTGDTGSDPSSNFLGTTDLQPLVLRTGNVQSLRIEPSSELSGGNPITANVIAGSSVNSVTGGVRGATIAGGGVSNDLSWAQGDANRVTDHYGTVGGGFTNLAGDNSGTALDAVFATVAGGGLNSATGKFGAIGGGKQNSASAENGTIAGGSNNLVSGVAGTVGGGEYSIASGNNSTVTGGKYNCAGGFASWAGGQRAKVRPATDPGAGGACSLLTYPGGTGDAGSFIWADSQNADFVSNGTNQFRARAGGGVVFNSNALPQASWDFVVGRRSGGDDNADLILLSRDDLHRGSLNVPHVGGGLVISADVDLYGLGAAVSAGRFLNTAANGAHLTTGGSWTNGSSRAFKEAVAAIDPGVVLQRVLDLDVSRWRYIGSAEGEHIGPMAEDFHAAFGTGSDDAHIATVDADGVALAAIQGLNAKLESENAALREAMSRQQQAMAELRALVEARIGADDVAGQ